MEILKEVQIKQKELSLEDNSINDIENNINNYSF